MRTNVKNKILLVEDDADTRQALAMLFELEGFEVVTAVDGEEAFSQALNERPDLIVTDINMPKVSGLDLIEMVRKDRRINNTPIVAMSAVERQNLNRAEELGAVAVAQKPIEFDNFLSLIAKVVSARSRRNRNFSAKERFRNSR
ncbi:MAG TPA: response regulator [Blastocatellia bacterium]|nr:response regulator [Blastocatellia bacterium]